MESPTIMGISCDISRNMGQLVCFSTKHMNAGYQLYIYIYISSDLLSQQIAGMSLDTTNKKDSIIKLRCSMRFVATPLKNIKIIMSRSSSPFESDMTQVSKAKNHGFRHGLETYCKGARTPPKINEDVIWRMFMGTSTPALPTI